MDGRFLSKPNVIQASRSFVCVRMMTYESASEAELLKTLWRPDAPLENTIFAILDPEGRSIVRGGRSPQMVFRDADDMAARMNEIAHYYGSNGVVVPKELPAVDTVRLAIDVAACDKRPLVIVVGQNDQERKQLASRLAPTAWSEPLIGKLVYTTGGVDDLGSIKNSSRSSGYVFVAPGLFGTDGTAIKQLGANASQNELTSASKQALAMFHPQELSHHDHMRAGRQNGIEWKTAIPVTDPHSLQAQQRDTRGGEIAQRGHPNGEPPVDAPPQNGPPQGGPSHPGLDGGPPHFPPPMGSPPWGGPPMGGHPQGFPSGTPPNGPPAGSAYGRTTPYFGRYSGEAQFGSPTTRRQLYIREYK